CASAGAAFGLWGFRGFAAGLAATAGAAGSVVAAAAFATLARGFRAGAFLAGASAGAGAGSSAGFGRPVMLSRTGGLVEGPAPSGRGATGPGVASVPGGSMPSLA